MLYTIVLLGSLSSVLILYWSTYQIRQYIERKRALDRLEEALLKDIS